MVDECARLHRDDDGMMKKAISTVLALLALVLMVGCQIPEGFQKGHVDLQLAVNVNWSVGPEAEVDEATDPRAP